MRQLFVLASALLLLLAAAHLGRYAISSTIQGGVIVLDHWTGEAWQCSRDYSRSRDFAASHCERLYPPDAGP